MENGEWATWFTILHSAPIQQKSHRIGSDTVAFIALFLINQLIQLGNMMRAGCSLVLRLLGIHADYRSGFLDGLHRARTGHAAARACHALEQIAVVLAGLGEPSAACGSRCRPSAFATLISRSGCFSLMTLTTAFRYAAGYRKVTAVRGCIVDAVRILLEVFHIDMTWPRKCLPSPRTSARNRPRFARSERIASSFFAAHGPINATFAPGCWCLTQSRGQRHRGERHRDAVGLFREQLLRHHRPRRTAGSRHERQLLRYFLYKVLGLLCGAQVRADGDLNNIGKAEAPSSRHAACQVSPSGRTGRQTPVQQRRRHARPPGWRGSSGRSGDLSAIAPNGQFTRHWPQETHLS